jgi:hypothetical protein
MGGAAGGCCLLSSVSVVRVRRAPPTRLSIRVRSEHTFSCPQSLATVGHFTCVQIYFVCCVVFLCMCRFVICNDERPSGRSELQVCARPHMYTKHITTHLRICLSLFCLSQSFVLSCVFDAFCCVWLMGFTVVAVVRSGLRQLSLHVHNRKPFQWTKHIRAHLIFCFVRGCCNPCYVHTMSNDEPIGLL